MYLFKQTAISMWSVHSPQSLSCPVKHWTAMGTPHHITLKTGQNSISGSKEKLSENIPNTWPSLHHPNRPSILDCNRRLYSIILVATSFGELGHVLRVFPHTVWVQSHNKSHVLGVRIRVTHDPLHYSRNPAVNHHWASIMTARTQVLCSYYHHDLQRSSC